MGFLDQARERQTVESEPLRELQRVEHGGKVLAVCERSGGSLVLARESERGLYPGGANKPANASEKRSREHGTERILKPTSRSQTSPTRWRPGSCSPASRPRP
jgi:hypothetical protein